MKFSTWLENKKSEVKKPFLPAPPPSSYRKGPDCEKCDKPMTWAKKPSSHLRGPGDRRPAYIDEGHWECKACGITRKPGSKKKMVESTHDRVGLLKDWIEKFKDTISVKQGYGTCEDCVHVTFHDAQDLSDLHDVDVWGLYHLEDYTVVAHVSGPAVVLMPNETKFYQGGGSILMGHARAPLAQKRRVEHLDSNDAYHGDISKKWNKYKASVEKKLDNLEKTRPAGKVCHRCGKSTLEKAERDGDGQWWKCSDCGARVYSDG